MSPRRGRLGRARDLRLALTTALTAWAAMLAWRGFTENPGRYLYPLLAIAVTVAVVGAGARALGARGWVVVPLQTVVAGLGVLGSTTGSYLPTPGTLAAAREVLDEAVTSATRYAAPVAGDVPPVEPLLLIAGVACVLVVELLSGTLRRVPLAGLPLLTVYTLPVSMLGGGVPWWVFALPGAGFVWMLYQHTEADLDRWDAAEDAGAGAGAEQDPTGFGVRTGGVRGTALGVGAAATGLAVVLPLLIPTLSLAVLDGPGPGSGDDEISLRNPMADMRRDLRRPDDTPLLRVTTDDPDPSYLRISVLNRFSDEAWTSGDRDLPADQIARGAQPPPVGVSEDVGRERWEWRLDATDEFASTWLPTPFPLAGIEAGEDWKWDDTTRDFIAADEDLTTRGLRYSATALDLDVTADDLARSAPSASAVGAEFLDTPSDLPLVVPQLARAVTGDATTDFERAVALQQWFRRDGGFTYDLRADEGNGSNALLAFLDDGPGGRTGYCEQFASAMAVMARTLGVPARVAVGFLEPSQVGDEAGTPVWEYSSDDLHAWPELYFPGAGWVRFEPTPGGRTGDAPAYTQGVEVDGETPETTPGQGDDQLPDQGEGSENTPGGTDAGPVRTDGSAPIAQGVPWRLVGLVLGVPALLALLLGGPQLLRAALHARRRRGLTPVEAAWSELADAVVDHGVPWPAGRSPAETRDLLLPALAAAPADVARCGVAALERLAHAVEVARYSRSEPEGPAQGWGYDVEEVRRCLAAASGRGQRVLARWAPRSLLRRPVTRERTRRTGSGPDSPTPVGAAPGTVVDHLG